MELLAGVSLLERLLRVVESQSSSKIQKLLRSSCGVIFSRKSWKEKNYDKVQLINCKGAYRQGVRIGVQSVICDARVRYRHERHLQLTRAVERLVLLSRLTVYAGGSFD